MDVDGEKLAHEVEVLKHENAELNRRLTALGKILSDTFTSVVLV